MRAELQLFFFFFFCALLLKRRPEKFGVAAELQESDKEQVSLFVAVKEIPRSDFEVGHHGLSHAFFFFRQLFRRF